VNILSFGEEPIVTHCDNF